MSEAEQAATAPEPVIEVVSLGAGVQSSTMVLLAAKGILTRRWVGISTDESHRAKRSAEPWAEDRYPLLELGMSRTDCLKWMKAQGFPLPSKCEGMCGL